MVELGAEFIHGKAKLTQQLLEEANISTIKTEGKMVSFYNDQFHTEDLFGSGDELKRIFGSLEKDISVADFIRTYLQGKEHEELRSDIEKYVEGYHAADLEKASSQALLPDFFSGEDENYRLIGGYGLLVDHLYRKALEGTSKFKFSEVVQEVEWNDQAILVRTSQGEYKARKLLVTISLGCLQQQTIHFIPSLPEITNAAGQMGFGSVIKMVLEFEAPFWEVAGNEDLSKMLFVFSEEFIPTWWTQYPQKKNIITGWFAGPAAAREKNKDEQQLLDMGLSSLSSIFNKSVEKLRTELKEFNFVNWQNDPFIHGAYSFEVVNGPDWKKIIRQPIANRIFFAGEALQEGSETGTVEAALNSGDMAAQLIKKSM